MAAGQQGGSVAEVALEAWAECAPQGFLLDAARLPDLLPVILTHVPDVSSWQQATNPTALDLGCLFVARAPGDAPAFQQLLKAQGGRVHFLYFWKAFGEIARMADPGLDDGLTTELETVRDRLLRRIEEESQGHAAACRADAFDSRTLCVSALAQEARRAAAMSACPRFWEAFAESLSEHKMRRFGFEDLTKLFLSLLRYAPVWEAQVAAGPAATPKGAQLAPAGREGMAVRLHIYDVSQEESIQKLNQVLANKYSPLKLGGVFHAGVEVNGLEWSFGFSPAETHPGVCCVQPKRHPQHHYRQTATLLRTKLSAEDIAQIISTMVEEYPGYDYDLLRRNCCHFADDFCRRLGVGGIPGWVHRLARLGAGIDNIVQRF
mmetsp:Transcript_77218/g.218551  ORF Transcript_77218/g.218551 Transcript_77218/m.218551 type:complete len:377 (+) Transcript_77218:99-1229(+)|eukprot:CAMPEP_0168376842 /NCGR_PEP_ID=MMETSP0228-20121227/10524_1 /TAXON_ID=133427 /ORGANISM="Protoceratium reticulatum, Strain CCCM 535 (=CCMP 1889)" /LENGTH=376 /DNA_ID=CAMNT_0008389831 /DNA_START=66 /DNA_END=1196 /DNA_ORIENTATION=+